METKVIIEVSGGVVTAVYANVSDITVRVVDHDNIKADPDAADHVEDLRQLAAAERDWLACW